MQNWGSIVYCYGLILADTRDIQPNNGHNAGAGGTIMPDQDSGIFFEEVWSGFREQKHVAEQWRA
jgi:hypothetical protein